MKLDKCPITGSEESVQYLNLGDIPLVNNLCSTREESLACKKYPLVVQLFPESGLSTLTEVIPKEELFSHYLYKSGVNKPYADHCYKMYDYLNEWCVFSHGDLVVDIGGNDGTLLKEFKKANPDIRCLNIDPCSDFMAENEANDIQYFNFFFNQNVKLGTKASLIVSTNVFQHNQDVRSFVKGIVSNLAFDGIWCLEFPYLLSTMIQDNYDQVYHEHIYYYRLKNIVDLLGQEGLTVVDASYHQIHAGTLRVLSVKEGTAISPNSSVESFLNLESFMTEEHYKTWGEEIQSKIIEFRKFIVNVSESNIIVGFGAAAKGCIFLNTCELDDSDIPFVIDDTPEKQGKFIPGTGIRIVGRETLWGDIKPAYILILAHNFKDYIIESLRKDGYEGKFIVMFPNIQVI
jgi:hypothetical protein